MTDEMRPRDVLRLVPTEADRARGRLRAAEELARIAKGTGQAAAHAADSLRLLAIHGEG